MRYSLKDMEAKARKVARNSKMFAPGYGVDDMAQEAFVTMWQTVAAGFPGQRDKRADAYMRSAGENRVRQIIRSSRAAKNAPYDAYGAHLPCISTDALIADDPAFIDYRTGVGVDDVEPPAALIPPCHPRGEDPEGYDTKDELCHNCADKFSCLPETAITKLASATIDDDPEVRMVVEAKADSARLRIAYEIVIERQRRRVRLRAQKRPVPPELALDAQIPLPPAPEPLPARQRQAGASLGAPAPDVAFPRPVKMPFEKTLGPAQLDEAMARIKVGQPFPVEIGHVFVKLRQGGGPDVCVEIREDGFWLNLNGCTYGSLSTAAKAAECLFGGSYSANRPGNAYFNIARCENTEIRDAATGAVLACKRGAR